MDRHPVGGLADFLHGLNIRAHGFHLLIQGAVLGGEVFHLGLPMLRDNFLAGRFSIRSNIARQRHTGQAPRCAHPEIFPALAVSGQQVADGTPCFRNTASTWKVVHPSGQFVGQWLQSYRVGCNTPSAWRWRIGPTARATPRPYPDRSSRWC